MRTLQLASGILELEYFRSPPGDEAGDADTTFVQTFTPNPALHLHCQDAAEKYLEKLTTVQRATNELDVRLKELEQAVSSNAKAVADVRDLEKVLSTVPQSHTQVQDISRELKKHMTNKVKHISEALSGLSARITASHNHERQAMQEVAHTLSLVSKSTAGISKDAQRLKHDYDKFQSALTSLLSSLDSNESMKLWSKGLISVDLTSLYTKYSQQLLTLRSGITRELLTLEAELQGSQMSVSSDVEKRNRYAFNVVKRVKAKLEGYEGETYAKTKIKPRTLGVTQHVEWMIREASNQNNLCQLYEGWAPWI